MTMHVVFPTYLSTTCITYCFVYGTYWNWILSYKRNEIYWMISSVTERKASDGESGWWVGHFWELPSPSWSYTGMVANMFFWNPTNLYMLFHESRLCLNVCKFIHDLLSHQISQLLNFLGSCPTDNITKPD